MTQSSHSLTLVDLEVLLGCFLHTKDPIQAFKMGIVGTDMRNVLFVLFLSRCIRLHSASKGIARCKDIALKAAII